MASKLIVVSNKAGGDGPVGFVSLANIAAWQPYYYTGPDGTRYYVDEFANRFIVGEDGQLYPENPDDTDDTPTQP